MASGLQSGNLVGHAIRIPAGADLVPALEEAADQAMKVTGTRSAFVMSAVGSLQEVTLRMANASKDGEKLSNEIKEWKERFEIVSLVGTFSSDGKHLHMSVSNKDGIAFGGHVIAGKIFTTLELVIGTIQDVAFTREIDDKTGFDELVVKKTT